MIAIPYCPCAVNTGSRLVVIDTGTGEANFKNSKGAAGQFHANLKAAGIDRNQVDVVIISHFHGDHINGLLDARQQAGVPECRDHGAGAGVEILHRRRRDEPPDHAIA